MFFFSDPLSPPIGVEDVDVNSGSQFSEMSAMMEVALTMGVSVMKSEEVSAPAEMCEISSPSSPDWEDGLQSPVS